MTKRDGFAKGFRTGAAGSVLAIRQTSNASLKPINDEREFNRAWLLTPPEQRVFISFSRADLEAAKAVRSALRSKGYQTFMYITEHGSAPVQASKDTGTYFRTAGHHFVIDSSQARSSPAVAYEAHWVTLLPPPAARDNIGPTDIGFKGPDVAQCWECCTYINGVERGCSFIGCGESAHQLGLQTCR